MRLPARSNDGTTRVHIELSIQGAPLALDLDLPAGPTRPLRMLPVFRELADEVLARSIEAAESEGRALACKPGCAACCRHLVPVSETEARRLAEIVQGLPDAEREAIRARFAEAQRRVEEAGLGDRLRGWRALGEDEAHRLGLEYFRARIDCPFLEDERCSIHPERPLACREYLVTSPPVHCDDPTSDAIAPVDLPGFPSDALARIEGSASPREVWWLPLLFALDWAGESRDRGPARSGAALIEAFLGLLAGESEPARPRRSKARGKKKKHGRR